MLRLFIVFLICQLLSNGLFAAEYRVGVGKYEITDQAQGLVMAGFGQLGQKTRGVRQQLYARAFIVEDKVSRKRIVLLNTDLWAMTHALKRAVINRLSERYGSTYGYDNCLFMATHHHSGPGGYSEYNLYNLPIGGFDETNFKVIVHGMLNAIVQAHEQMAEGHVYYGEKAIEDCGRNRSLEAYKKNPAWERNRYKESTDNILYLLQFTHETNGRETIIGSLTWYALHPTSYGQYNHFVSGDSKGLAASLVEECYPGAVMAFANGSAGDVSGNVEYETIPMGIDDHLRVAKLARQQADAAMALLLSPRLSRLSGKIDYRHQWWDMSKRTGTVGALGLSFMAGSLEDGDSGLPFREGMTLDEHADDEDQRSNDLYRELAHLGNRPILPVGSQKKIKASRAQYPKPVALYTGAQVAGAPLTPNVLPFHLLRLGEIVLAGFPAEMNTMAGRRLQEIINHNLPETTQVIPVSYANQYAQYIVTPEEYDAQHYEGASTLFGRNTLAEYLKIYTNLAIAIRHGYSIQTVRGHYPPNYLANDKVFFLNRVTVRNDTERPCTILFFPHQEPTRRRLLQEITVPSKAEVAVIFGQIDPSRYVARIRNGSPRLVPTRRGNLLSITPDGMLKDSPYTIQSPVSSANH